MAIKFLKLDECAKRIKDCKTIKELIEVINKKGIHLKPFNLDNGALIKVEEKKEDYSFVSIYSNNDTCIGINRNNEEYVYALYKIN